MANMKPQERKTILRVLEGMDAKPQVQLVGEDGNAMAIISACSRAGRRAGWTREQERAFVEECMSSNYDHVLNTAMACCDVS